MWKMICTQIYRKEKITIISNSLYIINIFFPIIPINMNLLNIEFDEDNKIAD